MRTLGITLLLLACSSVSVWAKDGVTEARPRALHEHPTLLDMLRVNNALRADYGRYPHRISPELTQAAQDHANYMALTGAFSHESNGGPMGRAMRHGYHGLVRENIACGQRSVREVFDSWQSSSGHWASIISDTTEAGFGYAISPDGTAYWVGMYGTSPEASVQY